MLLILQSNLWDSWVELTAYWQNFCELALAVRKCFEKTLKSQTRSLRTKRKGQCLFVLHFWRLTKKKGWGDCILDSYVVKPEPCKKTSSCAAHKQLDCGRRPRLQLPSVFQSDVIGWKGEYVMFLHTVLTNQSYLISNFSLDEGIQRTDP